MFINDKIENKNIAHGYLRNKLIKEIRKSLVTIRKEENKEEVLRKELLEKIKKGEFNKIPV